MKKFILLIILLCVTGSSFALEVVYPKKKQFQFSSPTTFFIGSASPDKNLYINGERVNVHKSGGFAKFVNLKPGANVFKLVSGNDTLIYNINRVQSKGVNSSINKFVLMPKPLISKVTLDRAPLRSTPVDAGINRLSHLPEGMQLKVDAEQNKFYRVILGKNYYGWIAKDSVETVNSEIPQIKIEYFSCKVDNEFYVCRFNLSEKTPWNIDEEKSLELKLFNVSDYKDNIFIFNFPLEQLMNNKNLLGYSAKYEGNDFVLKIRKPLDIDIKKPLDGVKIMLDPGHGGTEIGARGCLGDTEKDINLVYAKELKSVLEERGADVYMTRKHDTNLSLRERVDIANNNNSTVFISIHGNALPDTLNPETTSGTEIYYYYPQALPLAKSVMNAIEKSQIIKNNGIIQQSFAVVRNTEALSILIEIGYLINPDDNAKILNKDFRKAFVQAVADGLEEYFISQSSQ